MYRYNMRKGFTLIEMVVTVGIFALISMLVIVRNQSFDNELLLNDLAYDVALSIRQAQQFGINVRTTTQGRFDQPYGIHFTPNSTTYLEFIDQNANNIYDGPTSGELVEIYTLGRGASIQNVCNIATGTCVALTSLDVVFKRPNPDAILTSNAGALSQARVEIVSSRKQGTRYVDVQSTGQIAIGHP